jgi:hypothetical protein
MRLLPGVCGLRNELSGSMHRSAVARNNRVLAGQPGTASVASALHFTLSLQRSCSNLPARQQGKCVLLPAAAFYS